MGAPLSRDVPVDRRHAAFLLIDVQNFSVHPAGGCYSGLSAEDRQRSYGPFLETLEKTTLPNLARLVRACRAAGIEVMYTVMESLTADGRDRSLDYKISGILIPRGSFDARIPEIVAPDGDEMVFPKTSSSVFISTNIDYVLRNLGVRSLVVAGLLTDQCVDSAVRDACDLGYLVTLVTDACATHTAKRHAASLANNRGYCRQVTTAELLRELRSRTA